MPDMVNVTLPRGGLGQRNVSGGVELYRGAPLVFPHGVQCCTNATITLCVGMYSDLTLAANVSLATTNGTNYAFSVAATYGPNITGGVQFQLLTPTNVDPPVFQLTCTSTSSPPTDVLWTTNGSPVSNTSSQIVTVRPTSTYTNILTLTGRAYGMYTCTVTTTCSPVCGGFTLNPRSTTSSLTVQAPPGPPTGVTAVQSGLTSVSVSWTAPTSGGPVTRYDIYYVANGGPSTSGGSTNSTSYVLTNLQVGVQYNISVIAVGTYLPSLSAGTSAFVNATFMLPPTTTSSSSTGAIIGGIIGALVVLVLIIIIVVIVIILMRRTGGVAAKSEAPYDMDEKPYAAKPGAVTYETVDKKPNTVADTTYAVVANKKREPPPPVMASPQAMPSAQAISSTQDNIEDTYLNIPKTSSLAVLLTLHWRQLD
eukprot:Em0011g1115a